MNPPTGCADNGAFNYDGCCRENASPVLIDTDNSGFQLTTLDLGVPFKLTPNIPYFYRLSWTHANSVAAWLVLDRNGNGSIDDLTELFGDLTPQPTPPSGQQRNGFLALRQYDDKSYGGNGDGVIDSHDLIYTGLRLWQDSNHNGIAESTELHSLTEMGLLSISLNYSHQAFVDRNGNQFRFRTMTNWRTSPNKHSQRWASDVFLRTAVILEPTKLTSSSSTLR